MATALAPNVSEQALSRALERFALAVGAGGVLTSEDDPPALRERAGRA